MEPGRNCNYNLTYNNGLGVLTVYWAPKGDVRNHYCENIMHITFSETLKEAEIIKFRKQIKIRVKNKNYDILKNFKN